MQTQSLAKQQEHRQHLALSEQASTPRTQNEVLLKTLNEQPDIRIKAEPSVFGNEPPANDEDLETSLQTLAFAFPQQPAVFWGVVAKEAKKRGISKKRIDYMVEQVLSTHHYPTITVADIFDIDRYIHELTQQEFYSLTVPHKPLAQIFFGGKYRIVYKEDADAFGYPSEPFLSNAEYEIKERLEEEERARKEMEEWQKEHPNEAVSEEADLDAIVHDLSEQFSVKQKGNSKR
ncbi:MAG: hypothetical protein IJ640_01405 [Prevotella sp.]|nr:hypothetical protein [Prevotella sp.]